MSDPPVYGSSPTRARAVLVTGLGAAAVAALLLRIVSIAEPLGIDQSLWASAVRGLSRGQRLYVDVWEQRPPGIYWIYLAGFRVFGWTAAAVAWLDILAAAATTLLLYVIGRRLATPTTGVAAAALYATLTMPAWLYRHHGFLERSVCETFIVVCIAAAAWLAVRFRDRQTAIAAAGVGLFAGAAVVLKPNAGLYFPALMLWMALYARGASAQPNGISWRRTFVVAVLAASVVPVVAVLWLWAHGALGEAKIAVVDFNRFYVGQGLTIGGLALAFGKAVWLRIKSDPLWLAGGIASVAVLWELVRARRLSPLAGLAVLWGGAVMLVILVNGIRMFNSYFIQAFAPLALLAAWLFTEGARRTHKPAAVVAAVLMLALLVQRQYPLPILAAAAADFNVLRGRTDRHAYLEMFGGYANGRGHSSRANEEVAAYVRQHTQPDDQVYLFGISGAGVYFTADRLTAHRFLRVNFFVPATFPDPRFELPAVLDDLSARRPRYLIFEQLHTSASSEMARAADSLPQDPRVQALLRGYALETRIEDFTLYRRID
jgi:4-amino-4-deoxy-L-arabinose transferase-like glycosyltransferase